MSRWDEAGGCGGRGGRPGLRCCCRRRGQGRGRAKRGRIRAAVLALLAERPMHGYEIISEVSARTDGGWVPSPGAVYPALQLLVTEGLIDGEADGGRRRYALTDAGRAVVDQRQVEPPDWAAMAGPVAPADGALCEALGQVEAALGQVLATGTEEQQARALAAVASLGRSLRQIVADGDEGEQGS